MTTFTKENCKLAVINKESFEKTILVQLKK